MRILILSAAVLLTSAAVAQAPAGHPADLPAGPGRAQVQASCAGCHEIGVVTAKHYSAAKWDEVVQQMISRGAVVNDSDYDAVVAYLAKNYGKAPAK